MSDQPLPASFRDPSGFLFDRHGILYRQVNQKYQGDYDLLHSTGLYKALVKARLLIPHQEVPEVPPAQPEIAYKIIQPARVPFISYPYEWSFSQLKDAALTTLAVQKRAVAAGMSLKDSSAYNIQFYLGNPILIDTLSFERYQEGRPWVAYRQFCQHFLAPLALMALRDIRLNQLLRVYIDGIPLDLASGLLPFKTRLNFGLLSHLHLHASAQQRFADRGAEAAETARTRSMTKTSFLGLIDNLERTVQALEWEPAGEWTDYATGEAGEWTAHNYTPAGLDHKKQLVAGYLDRIQPESVWDLGANTGVFSRLASERGIPTLAFDIDPGAVEKNYQQGAAGSEANLLPLLLDLTNPSPAIGWDNQERDAFTSRGPAGAVLALALIHHLAIANNVPLERAAAFFARLTPWLIIEFVPKSDGQVEKLLATREDIFPDYTPEGFVAAFSKEFTIRSEEVIQDSTRILYLMERK